MSSREQSEHKFGEWQPLDHGGRLYWRDVQGRAGGRAGYYKEVNDSEVTLRFWQEIYDDSGALREVHHKFPMDEGHRKV